MNVIDKNIQRTKKENRNIFRGFRFGKDFWIDVIYAILSSAMLSGLLSQFLGIDTSIIATVIVLLVLVVSRVNHSSAYPEPFQPNGLFVGISDSADSAVVHQNDFSRTTGKYTESLEWTAFIPRKKEIDHIIDLINQSFEYGMDKTGRRKGICLVGASGCGKTVLLNMLVGQLNRSEELKYHVVNFDDIYFFNDEKNIQHKNVWLDRIAGSDKMNRMIAVFDQFEEVLQMKPDARSFVFQNISVLAEKENVVVLFSIREEYLMLFLEIFSVETMEESDEDSFTTIAVLENLVKYANCCPVSDGMDCQSEALTEFDLRERKSKDNKGKKQKNKAKKDKIKKKNKLAIPDFVMLESRHDLLPNQSVRECMVGKCASWYVNDREEGKRVYDKVADRPLIEQQIILNMKDQNEKLPSDFCEAYDNRNFAVLMRDYYDVQLCSTGQYMIACQIMYVLSKGRQENREVLKNILEDVLCSAEGAETEVVESCLKSLIDRRLVKTGNSIAIDLNHRATKSYEVTHDFVAQSFIDYAIAAMPSEMRSTLDDSFAVASSENVKTGPESTDIMKSYNLKRNSDGWINIVWIITCLIVITRFLLQRVSTTYGSIQSFLESIFGTEIPVKELIRRIDSSIIAGGNLSVPVMVMSIASLFYIYNFYRNITQFYGITEDKKFTIYSRDRFDHAYKRRYIPLLLYYASMIGGTAAAFTQKFWLLCLGLGNMFNGLSSMFVAGDRAISPNGRAAFRPYGWKTVICSVLLIVGSIAAFYIETITVMGAITKEFMQLFGMGVLLIFSYKQHMGKEFFYVHLQPLLHMKSL